MTESQPETKGPAPVSVPPTTSSEDVGTLSIRYTDGGPVVVVTGGHRIPRSLPIVNEEGVRLSRGTGQIWRFEVLDFDILPKEDPTGFVDLDGDGSFLE